MPKRKVKTDTAKTTTRTYTLTKPDNYQGRKLNAINIAAKWWFVNPKLEHDNKNAINSDWQQWAVTSTVNVLVKAEFCRFRRLIPVCVYTLILIHERLYIKTNSSAHLCDNLVYFGISDERPRVADARGPGFETHKNGVIRARDQCAEFNNN